MQTKKIFKDEEYELDNANIEEERDGVKDDSSIWYN